LPLFDPRPKSNRRDLYDREIELSLLAKGFRECSPLILLLGLRRTGKTSLLQVSLNETNLPNVIVNCRVFEEKNSITYYEFLEVFTRSLSKLLKRARGLSDLLSKVKGIKVAGFQLELDTSRKERPTITSILETINEWAMNQGLCVIIGFDEAQELAKLRGIRILPVLAYVYDHLKNISMVFTGSQIGMLYRFLKLHDPNAPLYGRVALEIRLNKFSYDQSIDFLEKGFLEYGIRAPRTILEHAVSVLDGIPGWLTMFGYYALTKGVTTRVVDEVLEKAMEMVLQEYKNYLRIRPIAAKRYTLILRAVAENHNSWSSIKRYLEVIEGKKISDYVFTQLLRNLVDAGFLEKKNNIYQIPDPILKQLLLKHKHI